MSRFDEIKEHEQELAKRRARPSALQIAWLVVILAFGGVVAWLALSGPNKPAPHVAVGPHEEPGTGDQAALAIPKPEQMPSPPAEDEAIVAEDTTPAPPAPKAAPKAGLSLRTDPALVEQTDAGPLPIVSADGEEPWKVYARPFDEFSTKPRIAVVISGLGLSSLVTRTAIETLPPEVTLAFSVYGNNVEGWVDEARGAGHEIMLMVPMEPYDYPKNDPGPDTLQVDLSPESNLKRLYRVLSRATRYVGITNDMGSKFTSSEGAITPILEELKKRGLLFLDARTSQYSVAARLSRELRVPRAVNNRYLDNDANEHEILKRLEELENVARTYGAAAGTGRPYPVTIRTVGVWAQGLAERGFVLAPITAVANRQPVR